MSGNWTYTLDPNAARAYVTLGAINNQSLIGYVTGTLRLELWATTSPPAYQGGPFFGTRLAIFPNNGQLAPGYSYININGNTPYTVPAYGTYWIVLMLAEYLPGFCSNPDSFCMVDNAHVVRHGDHRQFVAERVPQRDGVRHGDGCPERARALHGDQLRRHVCREPVRRRTP